MGVGLFHHLPGALNCSLPVDADDEVRLDAEVPETVLACLFYAVDHVVE